jgi:biopolymer transport protein ExbD
MPIKLSHSSDPSHSEARIEIVPLIDIMFFLLASFMLISLSMVHARTIKVSLPGAATATPDPMKHTATVSIDAAGRAFLDKKPVTDDALRSGLAAARAADPALRVVVAGDTAARHGDVIRVLDLVRSTGIEQVAFDVNPAKIKGAR